MIEKAAIPGIWLLKWVFIIGVACMLFTTLGNALETHTNPFKSEMQTMMPKGKSDSAIGKGFKQSGPGKTILGALK